MSVEVAIFGASGFVGAELLRLCAQHPLLEATRLFGDSQAGLSLGEQWRRALANQVTVVLEGHPDKLDDFEELLDNYGIVSLQRTGRVALPKLDRSARLRAVNSPNMKGQVG